MIGKKAEKELKKRYPSSRINNSRKIVRKLLEKMDKFPSEYLAQKLEDLGFTCDWSDKDYGEQRIKNNE